MANQPKRALCWIRRDLRTKDHGALAAASAKANWIAVVFVFDRNILDALVDRDDRRVTFIHRALREVDARLREAGSQLIVRIGDPMDEIPRLAAELDVRAVYTASDYEPYAVKRDAAVAKSLEAEGRVLVTAKDGVIFEGGEVLTKGGGNFRVFTPYSRAWRARFDAARDATERTADLGQLAPVADLAGHLRPWEMADVGFQESELWLEPGESAAHSRLEDFRSRIPDYETKRNFPGVDGTSGLSVHLRFGTISIRACVRAALEQGPAGEKWLTELIWRDFYQDVLWHHPDVVEMPFQAQYGNLRYPGLDEHFEAWCEGRTGYPIVDAAMRCLNATGWMHNRLRMVVASFLTKDLLVDYRKGEAYFARKLLDFDLASNNGGWQWAASTGADPQPYFRIFNPTSQSEKFDPEAEFIRRWLPELAELSNAAIHFPAAGSKMELLTAGVRLGETYPEPIVDHSIQRQRAIELLASVRNIEAK